MAEHHMHAHPALDRFSLAPFEDDPTALPSDTSDLNITEYDMIAGDHGLPAVNLNLRHPQASQVLISPDQRLSSAPSRSAIERPLDHPAFGAGPTRDPASMRHFLSQAQPHPFQSEQTYASADLSARPGSRNLEQSHHSSHPPVEHETQMHAPEVAHDSQSSSHGSPTLHTGAPTSTHLTNPELPPNENDGILFKSFEHALAERKRLFGRTLQHIAGDDVEEVDQNKGKHALAIKEALEHKDFLPPPENKQAKKKEVDGKKTKMTDAELIESLSDADNAKWIKWQERGQEDVELHLNQDKFEKVRAEWSQTAFRAWEVVSEIIKLHRQGYQPTKQKTDETLKCSARVEEAARVIKGYARVRHKILNGDKIPDFCINPEAYAKVTIAAFWNNSGRKPKDGSPASEDNLDKTNEGKKKSAKTKRNKKSTKKNGDSSVETADSAEQEKTGAVSSEIMADGSSSVDANGGEDEDAEYEMDESADQGYTNGESEAVGANERGSLLGSDFGDQSSDVLGVLSLRRPSQGDNAYFANFGNHFGNLPSTTPSFRPQIQARPRGAGRSEAFAPAAPLHPMLAPIAPMASVSSFRPSMTMSASYTQPSEYALNGFPTGPGPNMGFPSAIDYSAFDYQNAGLPNPQGAQSDIRGTRSNKRRRL